MPTVLITGASSGLGRALALLYAEPGTRLVLVGRDPARLDAVAEACGIRGAAVTPARLDLARTDIPAWIQAADAIAPIDLLIACAGITSGLGPGRDFEPLHAMQAVLATNLEATLALVHSLAQNMARRGRGHIAIVGSLAGFRGLPSSPAYSASKAALQAYAEAIRPALRRRGVVLSMIAPGFVRTPLNEAITAPKPLQISAGQAARRIRRGLDRRAPMIAFPWPLYAGLRLLSLLPSRLGDRILDRPGIDVPETAERAP